MTDQTPRLGADQWEVMDYVVDLTGAVPGEAVAMPEGWEPIGAERRSGALVVLLRRNTAGVAP